MLKTVLQDGSFSYPADGSDYKYLLELRAEAEYYGLTGLVETIDRYPVSNYPASLWLHIHISLPLVMPTISQGSQSSC